MPPPALVVEVVSPGKVNQDRDYRFKRSEYAARGIKEYWIVDPQISKVTVLILNGGFYKVIRIRELLLLLFNADKLLWSLLSLPQLVGTQTPNKLLNSGDRELRLLLPKLLKNQKPNDTLHFRFSQNP